MYVGTRWNQFQLFTQSKGATLFSAEIYQNNTYFYVKMLHNEHAFIKKLGQKIIFNIYTKL